MAGILQYLDFNQASTSRNLLHKRQNDGVEAPRNSLELPSEELESYSVIREDFPCSCYLKNNVNKSFCSGGTPIKKLINEEIPNRTSDISKKPGVVARLMGMDTVSSEIKPTIHGEEQKGVKPMRRHDFTETSAKSSASLATLKVKTRHGTFPNDNKLYSGQSTKETEWTRRCPRQHPQEEILQKFKRDFEAWQTSRVWEYSRKLELENLRQGKSTPVLQQEYLNRGKTAQLKKSTRNMDIVSATRPKLHTDKEGKFSKLYECTSEGSRSISINALISLDDEETNSINSEVKSLSPTRIVILKPCLELSSDIEEFSIGSPEAQKRENNMKDFLEEVKKRLKFEIEGRPRNNRTVRWVAPETSLGERERSANPKQIAQSIAYQIRDSSRSLASEVQHNGHQKYHSITNDTRKLLSERLKNVLRKGADDRVPLIHRRATSLLSEEAMRIRHALDTAKKRKNISRLENKGSVGEPETGSLRNEHQHMVDGEAVSPRNLVRSFSAPATGTTFVKLLSENQHILPGACVQRKHEACDHKTTEARRNRKDSFDLKVRVSNLRQNFALKRKLFGKKSQSADEPAAVDDFSLMRTFATTPSVVVNSGIAQENFTEVPPSPASGCSSPPEEMCRAGYRSPVSPLEASFVEGRSASQTSREISSGIPELTGLSEQVQNCESKEVGEEGNVRGDDDKIEIDCHAEAYVRNIITMAGLYEGQPYDQIISRWDMLPYKPIPKWVFDEMEENASENGSADISHRMLFDMINEALPMVLLPTPLLGPRFNRWFSTSKKIPQGKVLLDCLWSQIERSIDPPRDISCYSMDSIISHDLSTNNTWNGMLIDDIDVVGREMELEMLDELVCEIVRDVSF